MADGNFHANLTEIFKIHYLEAVEHTVQHSALYQDRIKKAKGMKKRGGGRQFEFPYETKRGMNFAPGNSVATASGGFLPGSSANTNDELSDIDAITAVIQEKRLYSGVKMDGFFKADSHGKYLFKEGHNFSRLIKYMVEDFSWNLQRMLLGDATGLLGVQSGGSASSGGHSVVTLLPATGADTRGRLGNAMFRENQKVLPIPAAHWAASATVSQSDLIGGNTWLLVEALSEPYDTGASPTVTFNGTTYNSDEADTDGTVFVLATSRTSTDGGSDTGATLNELQGLFNWIDDGTLGANLFGLSRTTYPTLQSKVDLSTTLREVTPELLQGLIDKINRRVGDNHDASGYEILTEQSVRTQFSSRLGEEAKRYIQESKGKKAVGGFNDVSMAFLGNDAMIPWRVCRDMPYGHLMYLNPSMIEAFWSKEVAPMDDDGLTLRQVAGYDEWALYYKAYGEMIMQEPWKCGRISGCQGYFG
jgi:hypothetical protein